MPSDDLGHHVDLAPRPQRIVSLVPSLTEALAHSVPDRLVGATDWCTHPPDLSVTRVRGTKNPDVEAIVALRPRPRGGQRGGEPHRRPRPAASDRHAGLGHRHPYRRRRADVAGPPSRRIGGAATGWLDDARRAWASPSQVASQRIRAVVPIWRRPWMHVGSDTYAGDVLRRLGVDNALADHSERYPAIALDELPEHDLVVLPDEPYAFSPTDGPEAFAAPCALVSGRSLTWYGPAMVDAPSVLLDQLREAL
jgi:hypothetical protein